LNYSALVLDLDGTLLNSRKQVSGRNMKAIISCHQRGMRIIFATARPPRSVRIFLHAELLNIGSFIYYNGALAKCDLTGLDVHEAIDSALTADMIDYCSEHRLRFSIEVKDEWLSAEELDFSEVRVDTKPVVKPLEELRLYHATKLLITGHSELDGKMFRERYGDRMNILLTDSGKLIQVMSRKASKEAAVSALCGRIGIPLSDVIVFGDDYNDLGLFKLCGYSVAMGNAIPELKAIASETADTNDNDGVAKVLETRILSAARPGQGC